MLVDHGSYVQRITLILHNGGIEHVLFSKVNGPSMLPTMSVTGDWVLEENLTTHIPSLRPLKRGDIVVATSPFNPRAHICKRVLGLPGDIICVDPTGEYAPSTEHVLIPKGHLWLVGDNASMSRDSRTYGPVPMALVRGRVIARYWPWKDRTIFGSNVTSLGVI
ncbi:LexA/Signal peptidase [Schizopora paradoxa]|uniref:LexA/Signal peptidase n=1 Tax=Schizopora paradoxa TaxID=27342 RepID=A0A0H2RPL9_9AGAM|nr:LexA/Signal peptidase [Schizopora paradoxa]